MKQENILQQKSYAFALGIVNLYRYLTIEKKEFILAKQLLRSGTSIGANVAEAIGAQSEKDFYAKLHIAYKECRESHYWIRLLRDSGYLSTEAAASLLLDCEELLKITGSIIKTLKSKFNS